MAEFSFKVKYQDAKTKARIGEIHTPHGIIHTPAFVPVGTQASVKSLTPAELQQLNVELFFVNTYHAYLRPGLEVINKFGGLHKFMNWNRPLITDSGGFQVFSLARRKDNKTIRLKDNKIVREQQPILVKITDDGVEFRSHWDGSKHFFTPEKSIEIQHQLGADLIIAFDECTPFPATEKYAQKALDRTHRWAERSLNYNLKVRSKKSKVRNNYQALYGVIQGSIYKDLRIQSADFIAKQGFDGIAIGGVSVGESKQEMKNVCDWVIPRLPQNKPRHLLGVGEIDDIFEIIERGVDTFDCVAPTRMARNGRIYINNSKLKTQNSKLQLKNNKYAIDITNNLYSQDTSSLDLNCSCYMCQHFSKAYIHHLFHVRELLAYRLASIHNVHFVIQLIEEIKTHLTKGTFLQFKQDFLKY